ncbi:MAG: hypothetical protein IKK85_07925 [Clostridia bacterium]|nr:hypothetical protein [Clostridia bacterium]
MINQNELNKYIKHVEKNIPCFKKEKQNCINVLKASIEDLISTNPNITLSELCETFGKPKVVAKNFTNELDPLKIRKYKILKSIFFFIILGIFAVIVIGFISNCIYDLTRLDYTYFFIKDLTNTP